MNRNLERNDENLCCICLDSIETGEVTPCDTCRTIMHDQCIIEMIQNTVNYAFCPHCRSPLPDKFITHIITRRINNAPFASAELSETELNVEETLRSFLRWNLVQLEEQQPVEEQSPTVPQTSTTDENRPVPNDPNALNVNNLYWC